MLNSSSLILLCVCHGRLNLPAAWAVSHDLVPLCYGDSKTTSTVLPPTCTAMVQKDLPELKQQEITAVVHSESVHS